MQKHTGIYNTYLPAGHKKPEALADPDSRPNVIGPALGSFFGGMILSVTKYCQYLNY